MFTHISGFPKVSMSKLRNSTGFAFVSLMHRPHLPLLLGMLQRDVLKLRGQLQGVLQLGSRPPVLGQLSDQHFPAVTLQ